MEDERTEHRIRSLLRYDNKCLGVGGGDVTGRDKLRDIEEDGRLILLLCGGIGS